MLGVLFLSMILLSACNRDLDVQNVFPFEVRTMPFPMSLKEGETIEVRQRSTLSDNLIRRCIHFATSNMKEKVLST